MPDVKAGGGLAFLLSQLGFVASRRFHQSIAPLGIEPRHFLVLRYVVQEEGRSQQALGELLNIPASRMVAVVDHLEERGWVERRANPNDRRARALHVTPEGRRFFATAMQVAMEQEASFGSSLSDEERTQLIALLRKVAAGAGVMMGVHPGLTIPEGDPASREWSEKVTPRQT